MAKKTKIEIELEVDDKGTTKKVSKNSEKLGDSLNKTADGAERASKGQEKVSRSSRDASRNMQGLSKRTSNSSKEFSKMSQGMGGLVGAYATLAAQVFAVSAAFQFLSEASQLRNLIEGQKAMGAVTGTAFKSISNSVIEATDGMLKFAEASRAVAIGAAAGLTSSQLTELGTAAKNASFALGRDLTDSFNRLIRGVTKAEPELLDELGIILRLEAATEKYGVKIGKAANDLNAFERSQAVANEVLEQAERKFGAIEALMDPNAAALSQFTKSFDELINIFKIGLIETLTPVLTFLTKNTTALTAALGLFALPIIKAILPNLRDWRMESEELFERYNKNSERFEKDAQKQSAAIKKVADEQISASERAKKAIGEQGGTRGRASLDYMTGTRDDKTARAAADKVLNKSKIQYDQHGKVITGILKGYNRQQVTDLQTAFAGKEKALQKFTRKFNSTIQTIVPASKMAFFKMRAAFAGVMGQMSAVAARTAMVINGAMSLVGFLGTVALLASFGKEIYDYFFPISEELKKQAEAAQDLSEKYATLREETERAQEAREKLLIGAQGASNVGQVLQSIDIERNLFKDIQELGSIDPGTENYTKAKANIQGVLDTLVDLDPRFKAAAKEFRDTSAIKETSSALLEADKEFRELGFTIDRIPELLGKADASFRKLTGSLLKTSPISQFVSDQREAVQATAKELLAAQNSAQATVSSFNKGTAANAAQAKRDKDFEDVLTKELAKTTGVSGKDRRDFKEQLATMQTGTPAEKDALRAEVGIDVVGRMTPEQIKEQEARMAKEGVHIGELAKAQAVRQRKLTVFSGLEVKMLGTQKERLVAEAKSLQTRTQGLTIEGQIANKTADRLNAEKGLQKASDQQLVLQTLVDDMEANKLEYSKEEKAEAEKSLEVAKQNTEIARIQKNLKQDAIDLAIAELNIEKSLLSVRLMAAEKQREANQLRATADFTREVTGGGFAGAQVARGLEDAALQASVESAQKTLDAANTVYNNALQTRIDELLTLNKTQAEATRIGTAETDLGQVGTAKKVAEDALLAEQRKQYLQENAVSILNNQTRENIAILQYQNQNVAISREKVLLEERVLALRKLGIEMNPKELEDAKKLFKKQAEQEEQLKNQKQLSLTIQSQMEGAFMAIVDGSKSAKQAFADMAKAILADIAKMIIKMMVLKALQAVGLPGFKDGGITPSYRYGGMTRKEYNSGGIARGPQSGYQATLHGNEAIVPLPNNRSIPVEFPQGGPGGGNNVTVNVTMNNDGSSQSNTQGDGASMGTLGNAIAKAVQTELQNQKRAGGILSPYGAA